MNIFIYNYPANSHASLTAIFYTAGTAQNFLKCCGSYRNLIIWRY